MNPLLALRQLGQSVWLDHISRRLITGGTLHQLDQRPHPSLSSNQGRDSLKDDRS